MAKTNHYHFIAGVTERCTSNTREAFKTIGELTAIGVASKVIAGSDTTWTLTDGSTVVMRPMPSH